MIRSSRIPPLLDKICTDGIVSSLLISKDGELLGSSTINAASTTSATITTTTVITPSTKNSEAIQVPQGALEDAAVATNNNTNNNNNYNMIAIGSSSAESSSPPSSLPSWVNMNPSDIGALIAEVVEDYKQLGYELSMLDPSFAASSSSSSPSPSGNGGNTATTATAPGGGGSGGAGGGGGSGVGNSVGGSGTNNHNPAVKNMNMSADNNDVGVGLTGGEGKQQEDGAKNNVSSKATGGNDSGTMKETNGNKDKGRLNCLIMELESGIIGVTSATSSTYVIALAESTTQHGLLKDRLTVLASLLDLNIA